MKIFSIPLLIQHFFVTIQTPELETVPHVSRIPLTRTRYPSMGALRVVWTIVTISLLSALPWHCLAYPRYVSDTASFVRSLNLQLRPRSARNVTEWSQWAQERRASLKAKNSLATGIVQRTSTALNAASAIAGSPRDRNRSRQLDRAFSATRSLRTSLLLSDKPAYCRILYRCCADVSKVARSTASNSVGIRILGLH